MAEWRPSVVGSRSISTPYEAAIPQLRAAQEGTDTECSRRLAQEMTHIPKGDLVFATRAFSIRAILA